MLKNFANSILSFLTGIVFTLLIIMVGVVVYLFSENSRLRREVEDVKNELSKMELKFSSPPVAEETPPVTGSTQMETYLIPNQIPTRPITGSSPELNRSNNQNPAETAVQTQEGVQQVDYTGPRTFTIKKEVEVQPVTGKKDYEAETDKQEKSSKNTQTSKPAEAKNTDNLSEPSDNESSLNSDEYTLRPIYDSGSWDKLKENMTKSEVKDLLGKPNQILTRVNSTTYVYIYNEGTGSIYFDKNGLALKWQKPGN